MSDITNSIIFAEIGATAGVVILMILVYCFCCRHKPSNRNARETRNEVQSDPDGALREPEEPAVALKSVRVGMDTDPYASASLVRKNMQEASARSVDPRASTRSMSPTELHSSRHDASHSALPRPPSLAPGSVYSNPGAQPVTVVRIADPAAAHMRVPALRAAQSAAALRGTPIAPGPGLGVQGAAASSARYFSQATGRSRGGLFSGAASAPHMQLAGGLAQPAFESSFMAHRGGAPALPLPLPLPVPLDAAAQGFASPHHVSGRSSGRASPFEARRF